MKQIPWERVIDRLGYHRQRLKLSKDDCKFIIDFRYGKKFYHLDDDELIDFGKFLAGCSYERKEKKSK